MLYLLDGNTGNRNVSHANKFRGLTTNNSDIKYTALDTKKLSIHNVVCDHPVTGDAEAM